MPKRIFITPGEPAGIGPDIVLQIAQQPFDAELITIADPDLLQARARQLNLGIRFKTYQPDQAGQHHTPGTLTLLPVKTNQTPVAGKPDTANASYVINSLKTAAQQCQAQANSAIVTGPVNKSIINEANIPFTGHTEFFADYAGVEKTVMLFVTDNLKVALATTHLPLKEVSNNIDSIRLSKVIHILHHDLQQKFDIANPKIAVCGLNPHAGENGHLGKEEIETIIPVLKQLQTQGINLSGPYPADSIFSRKITDHADAILAMYHDQGLPVIKYASFGQAVNVTLGLPFVRTSVDHGTAYDIAATGRADASSLQAAIKLAITLA